MPNEEVAMPDHRFIDRASRRPLPRIRSWGWQDEAACRVAPSDLFFGPDGEKQNERDDREVQALEICGRCPVREPCQRHAVELPEPYGVWGGTTESARLADRRARLASPAA
jgi:WhiB family transcriptional regulator, redox-sensing transcriptional regulator